MVDFGSQYTHLIARRIRYLGVYSEVVYPSHLVHGLDADVMGLVLSGGPMSVYDPSSPKMSPDILRNVNVPILGICYGHQLIAHIFEGVVSKSEVGEYGLSRFYLSGDHILFEGVPRSFIVWMSHKDSVVAPPEGFSVLGYTGVTRIAAMANDNDRIYSLQFHPEVAHTEYGLDILRNYIFRICGCEPNWSPMVSINNFFREYANCSGEAVVAVSGGIDSTVTAVVLRRIFGKGLYPVFIDTGLLRIGEREWVKDLFKGLGFDNLIVIDASDIFLDRLRGVVDPEEKRRIISDTYVEVLRQASRELGGVEYLGQGTLYPDRVESGATSSYTDKIKSHHNVVAEEVFGLKVLEPLRDLYKDEVRELARELGLPDELITRHPFPGPGLAIRIVGEVTREKLEILRRVDKIVDDYLRSRGLYESLWQFFPVLLSVKSVGIRGDHRHYGYIISLRGVESLDAMTARFARIDWDFLEELATRILNEVEGVSRVVYDISNKPPATIEYE